MPTNDLTPAQGRALQQLRYMQGRGDWIRLDKIVGDALLRRGLVERRGAGRGCEYRLAGGGQPETPPTPKQKGLFE